MSWVALIAPQRVILQQTIAHSFSS